MNPVTFANISREELGQRVDSARAQLKPDDTKGQRELDVFTWQIRHHEGADLKALHAAAAEKKADANAEKWAGIGLQTVGYMAMGVGWVALVYTLNVALMAPIAIGAATCIWGAVDQTLGKQDVAAEKAFENRLDRFAQMP